MTSKNILNRPLYEALKIGVTPSMSGRKRMKKYHSSLTEYGFTPRVMAQAIAAAHRRGIPLLVDPKVPHMARYAGATLLTPNHHEAESATGIRNQHLVQKSMGMSAGSFNTREFFHGRPREVVRAARWAFLALVFPVPGALLLFAPHSTAMLFLSFVLQYAGLLAERWYFFAEARHPQNLYYQAIA